MTAMEEGGALRGVAHGDHLFPESLIVCLGGAASLSVCLPAHRRLSPLRSSEPDVTPRVNYSLSSQLRLENFPVTLLNV